MLIYPKNRLLDFIVRAVNECGWNVLYISGDHPFKLKIYKNETHELIKIIIYNMTHGGGQKRPANEYRIQIKEPRLEQEIGYKTLILGYWAEMEIFAGFDIRKHIGAPGYSSSMQIRSENLEKAFINGFSACNKGNQEIAVAFRPDFFVEYVQNLEKLHTFGDSEVDFDILEAITDKQLEINEEIIQKISQQRRTTVLRISKKLRDNSFRARVLTAYAHKCAVCGLQLKLIDAAHILPVTLNDSTDETNNGIALCTLHHRAYDVSLVTFDERYRIRYNAGRMKILKEIKHDGGMRRFIKSLRPLINLPPAINDRPHVTYVKRANEMRGWNFDN